MNRQIAYAGIVNLNDLFNSFRNELYVIIKLSDHFPNYYEGEDIDIFCYDLSRMSQLLIGSLTNYLGDKFKLDLNYVENSDQCHIDLVNIANNKIHLRFDLYGSMPCYKNINVRKCMFYSILENRLCVRKSECEIFLPSLVDDLIIRYLEYIEYYSLRNDKLKHLFYVELNVSKLVDQKNFYEKLHMYCKPPTYDIMINNSESDVNRNGEKMVGIIESLKLFGLALKRRLLKEFSI